MGTMKKEKPRCKNCNDKTTFPANVGWEREQIGWCVPCFQYRKKNLRVGNNGKEYWRERTIADRTPYDSRPPRE